MKLSGQVSDVYKKQRDLKVSSEQEQQDMKEEFRCLEAKVIEIETKLDLGLLH